MTIFENSKTISTRVAEAIKKANFSENENGVNEVIAYAYELGRHEAARECCKKAKEIFNAQLKRAEECRYNKMALEIQGNITGIYHDAYSTDFVDAFQDATISKPLFMRIGSMEDENKRVKIMRGKVPDIDQKLEAVKSDDIVKIEEAFEDNEYIQDWIEFCREKSPECVAMKSKVFEQIDKWLTCSLDEKVKILRGKGAYTKRSVDGIIGLYLISLLNGSNETFDKCWKEASR